MSHTHSSKSILQFIISVLFCLALTLSLFSPSLASPPAQQPTPTPVPTQTPGNEATPLPGVPVKLGDQTLFYVYQRIGSLTPAERAALISKRIEQLASDPFAPPPEITLVESDQGTDLMIGELVLMTITNADATTADMPRDQVAETDAKIIREQVQEYRRQNTPLERAKRLFSALLILATLLLILYFVDRFLRRRLERIEQAAAAGQTTAGLYRTSLWRRLTRLLLNLGRWAVALVILLIVAPLVLRSFPLTVEFANQMLTYLTDLLSEVWAWFTDNRSDLFTIIIIFLITYGLARLVSAFFAEVEQGTIRFGHFEPEWAPFTRRIINFLLLVGALVVAFPYIPGSDTEAFKGITIFLGALFTLASTAAVSNIVAGVIQTYTGAFRVNDVVKIGETTGIVLEKSLLTTRVRTFKQEDVSIPNSVVMSASVVNYSTMARQSGVILYTTITIGYDAPWRTVHSLLMNAAANTTNILKDPPPFILQTSLNDFHISYQLNCYTDHPEVMARVYSELHANIQDSFNQGGIEIMSPGFTALRDGNTVTIPPEQRPADYQAPGFRVERGQ